MANEKNNQAAVSQTLLGANDKGRVTYQVNGEDINLSFQIVRNFLTRGDTSVTDAEIIQFISLCKANKLNPFIGEAWLVKYDAKSPAQMLTARDAFMKRAEENPKYEGYRSGVILLREKEIIYQEGAFFLPTDTLVGGWAEVHRSDRKFPVLQRVRLVEYTTGKSTWAKMPGTMIQKVAEAHAFRKAFPMVMAGLYTPEEMPEEQAQPAQQQPGQANAAIAQFTEAEPEEGVDAPAPEEVADPEPPAFTPDPEPEPVPVQAAQGQEETDANLLIFNV
jgi:phage recombination protein Bet